MSLLIKNVICAMIGSATTYLQLYLSKKESKWLGLILPTIYILFPVFLILITNSHKRESAKDIFYLIMLGVVGGCFLLVIHIFHRLKESKAKL